MLYGLYFTIYKGKVKLEFLKFEAGCSFSAQSRRKRTGGILLWFDMCEFSVRSVPFEEEFDSILDYILEGEAGLV
jgi:hypothetical protein